MKLWRSDYNQVHESCVARRQFLNLVTWDVSSLISCFLSLISPTKGVKGDLRGSQCTSNSTSPHPLSSCRLKKKPLKLPVHRYLPAPTTFHFLPPPYFFRPFLLLPYWSVPPPSVCDHTLIMLRLIGHIQGSWLARAKFEIIKGQVLVKLSIQKHFCINI